MSERPCWSPEQMPDQTGRTIMITGVTSGLGKQAARDLLQRGARVILAARSADRLAATEQALRAECPQGRTERLLIDLADLQAVRRAAAQAKDFGPIDVLINNAGVMATPYQRTGDGLELQMATNHFGPFLLSGLLLAQLAASGDGRIVTVSSNAHRMTDTAPLGDPRSEADRSNRVTRYARSKLANLLFTYEAQRRLTEAGVPVRALAAHPGYAATQLLATGQAGGSRGRARYLTSILDAVMRAGSQPVRLGVLPILMAATADLPGGTYCGPGGFQQWRGLPRVVGSSALARDPDAQRKLWELSEQTVGLAWP